MSRKLELKFKNTEGRIVTVSLDQPSEPVDPVAIKQAMDEIITYDVFESTGGSYAEVASARIVDHQVEEIELV
ncbi:DUF2922 domain-containing protein [Halalkalibacillus sediminis]|uniref:DUF2922 domain-containing protein n=1 Tax=Halalkalibacillus sediminis TaxID=2018042 RepID=A0A2I0QVT9_9BACI|nr:DUF2922 domain-containing protein [Halalkalibacillus sediminis]PKR78455.1 DUF2922 domain-containing protein [Halalkalibacillus sediminis]